MVIAVTVIDVILMPQAFSEQVVPLRAMTMIVPLLGALGATFLLSKRHWLPYLLLSVAMLIGFSSLYSSVAAPQSDARMILGNTLFITFNIYLVLGLNFWLRTIMDTTDIPRITIAIGPNSGTTEVPTIVSSLESAFNGIFNMLRSSCWTYSKSEIFWPSTQITNGPSASAGGNLTSTRKSAQLRWAGTPRALRALGAPFMGVRHL